MHKGTRTHLLERLGVVDVVITIQVEDEGRVRDDPAGAHQTVHGTGLLVVVVLGALLTGHVHEPRQLVHLDVREVAVRLQQHLKDMRKRVGENSERKQTKTRIRDKDLSTTVLANTSG